MPLSDFRQLSLNELDLGYSVYLSAFEWLKAQGIRQWLVPLPRSVYEARQARGENYGLFVDDQLAVIVSLGPGTPAGWADVLTEPQTWWVHTLAAGPDHRGRGLGARTLQRATAHLQERGLPEVYLDCLAGVLPAYYARLGFAQLGAKDITYPSGNTFPMVLMKKDLKDA
jgi:GNAT superfamily N-acetyltransferase